MRTVVQSSVNIIHTLVANFTQHEEVTVINNSNWLIHDGLIFVNSFWLVGNYNPVK